MKQGSTTFLKFIIYLLAIGGLGLCLYASPMAKGSSIASEYRPLLLAMYATAIPFFFGLYKGHTLLKLIDQNLAFSNASVVALKHIKYAAFAIALVYAVDLPFTYLVSSQAGIRGRMFFGLVLTAAPFVVAVFAAVLEKLLQSGMDIKSENDLTI